MFSRKKCKLRGAAVAGHCSLSDDEIVRPFQLHLAQQPQSLSNESSARKVIKVANGVVVKFGLAVTYQEASARNLAFETVNQDIVLVARVYDYSAGKDMVYRSTGYLVMEHIEGENFEQIAWDKNSILPHIAADVREIHSITNQIITWTSLRGRCTWRFTVRARGREFVSRSIEDLQAWMNRISSFYR